MIIPWPAKLASPCIWTHMTLSPSIHVKSFFKYSGDWRREYCFARARPRATGFIASVWTKQKSVFNRLHAGYKDVPRWEGLGSRDTWRGRLAFWYVIVGFAAKIKVKYRNSIPVSFETYLLRWLMTSPTEHSSSGNSLSPLILWKSAAGDNWRRVGSVRRLSRPRWGIARIICSIPPMHMKITRHGKQRKRPDLWQKY